MFILSLIESHLTPLALLLLLSVYLSVYLSVCRTSLLRRQQKVEGRGFFTSKTMMRCSLTLWTRRPATTTRFTTIADIVDTLKMTGGDHTHTGVDIFFKDMYIIYLSSDGVME